MDFIELKKRTLEKMQEDDRSKKGSVDHTIKDLITLINKSKNLFTTSSCGGRLLVYEKEEQAKKNKVNWLYQTHEIIDSDELLKSINNSKNDVWFATQPVILHITAKDQETAHHLLTLANKAGLKRGGAISIKDQINLEIKGVDEFATIIIKDGTKVVSEDYLYLLIEEAKKKLTKNKERIDLFFSILQDTFI